MIEQTYVTKKTDTGYYVEVFNDGKLAWTDTFEIEEWLNEFIENCNKWKELGSPYLSQDEARKMLENNEYSVNVFYRQPKGYRFASISYIDLHENNEHVFTVIFVNKDNVFDIIDVPTIDEAFQVLTDVEI